MADRERTAAGLTARGFDVLPSQANFVFARHPDLSGEAALAGLRAQGILVRRFGQERIADWLRISIGTAEECDLLLSAMDGILSR